MRGRPIWGLSAWAAFACALFAVSSLMHGAAAASGVMLIGALLLVGWAIWLSHHGN